MASQAPTKAQSSIATAQAVEQEKKLQQVPWNPFDHAPTDPTYLQPYQRNFKEFQRQLISFQDQPSNTVVGT